MKNRILFSLLLTVFSVVFTLAAQQDKYVKHTVLKGETVTMIAQKYKVTPFDIYKLNPDSQKGVELNQVLLIPPTGVSESKPVIAEKKTEAAVPVAVKTITQGGPPTTHLVQPKETMYSISKQYNITIDELKAANGELLNNGLKIGQKIKIPTSSG